MSNATGAELSIPLPCKGAAGGRFGAYRAQPLLCETTTPPRLLWLKAMANVSVVCSDNSGGLDRDEFKRALQIWGMDEEALNEVRTRSFYLTIDHHA